MRFLKKSNKSNSPQNIDRILKDSLKLWRQIVEHLRDPYKVDFGRIWLEDEIERVKALEELIKRIKLVLEKSKSSLPQIENEINQLIYLLDLIATRKLKGNVLKWFKSVKEDFKMLIRDIESRKVYWSEISAKRGRDVEKFNQPLLEKIREKKPLVSPRVNFRFTSIPVRFGEISIGNTINGSNVNPVRNEILYEISIPDTKLVQSFSFEEKFPDEIRKLKRILILPLGNIPDGQLKSQAIKKEFVSDGGRSVIVQENSYYVDLSIFGCKGVQEFKECRKGVGVVGSFPSEIREILPRPYRKDDKRPLGAQFYPYALGEIETTDELFERPECSFKFCPTLYAIRIPPEFLMKALNRATQIPQQNMVFLKNAAQEVCLIPSTIRLGTFKSGRSDLALSYLSPIPQQAEVVIKQAILDLVRYFELVARGIRKKGENTNVVKIGDWLIELDFFKENVNLDWNDKSQIFKIKQAYYATPISKDVMIAPSGLYFKDLESLDLNFIIPRYVDYYYFIKMQLFFLFYDLFICVMNLNFYNKQRANNDYLQSEMKKWKINGELWYEFPMDYGFLNFFLQSYEKSPLLFTAKGKNNCLVLGIKTEIGEISFETYIDYGFVERLKNEVKLR